MEFLYLNFNFYLLISESYVLKAANDLCSNTLLIDNLDKCKSGITYLKNHGVDVVYQNTESVATWPKGCYRYNLNSGDKVYWNTHSSGKANYRAQPICKEGEYIKITIPNLLQE